MSVKPDLRDSWYSFCSVVISLAFRSNASLHTLMKSLQSKRLIISLFDLIHYVSVNSYGHVEMVSSSNHTFSWTSLTKWLTSTSCTYFVYNWQHPFLNQQKEENGGRNYFMINLHKIMGLGRDRIRDPWNCSQTCICSQTRHQLRLVTGYDWFVISDYGISILVNFACLLVYVFFRVKMRKCQFQGAKMPE